MALAAAAERLRADIRDAAAHAVDSFEFRSEVLAAIRARIPFDAVCLATVDPATLIPTSLTTEGYEPSAVLAAARLEYGGAPEPNHFELMLRRPQPIRTMREATGGQVRRTRQYAELLAPYGLLDEVRMLFPSRDRTPWGMCTMTRRPGSEFEDDEVALLGRVLVDVGDGLRTTLFSEHAHRLAAHTGGPAVAVIGPDNEVESISSAAADYFERLAWGSIDRPVAHAPALAAALLLRRSGREPVVLRSRTVDGEWVVIRVGALDTSGPTGRIVVTVERAQPAEIVSLLASAQGLTPRESDVLAHLLAGRSRDEIAAALRISPYTVADHLKAIYAKTGVNGRRGLVARLVDTQYLPRLGSPLGADGFFAEAERAP